MHIYSIEFHYYFQLFIYQQKTFIINNNNNDYLIALLRNKQNTDTMSHEGGWSSGKEIKVRSNLITQILEAFHCGINKLNTVFSTLSSTNSEK